MYGGLVMRTQYKLEGTILEKNVQVKILNWQYPPIGHTMPTSRPDPTTLVDCIVPYTLASDGSWTVTEEGKTKIEKQLASSPAAGSNVIVVSITFKDNTITLIIKESFETLTFVAQPAPNSGLPPSPMPPFP